MPTTMGCSENWSRQWFSPRPSVKPYQRLPERVLHVKPREDIVDTSRPTSVRLIRTGIACRYTLRKRSSSDHGVSGPLA